MIREAKLSAIEVLVTSALVVTVTSIAVSCFLNAKIATNEAAVIKPLRSITHATHTYRARHGIYPVNLQQLREENLIDDDIAKIDLGKEKSGYLFTYAGILNSWNLSTSPARPGLSGIRHFFINQSGAIRQNERSPASHTDPLIQ